MWIDSDAPPSTMSHERLLGSSVAFVEVLLDVSMIVAMDGDVRESFTIL